MSRRHTLPALCATLALAACRDRPDGAGLTTAPHARGPAASRVAVRVIPRVPGRPLPVLDSAEPAGVGPAHAARHLTASDAVVAIGRFGRARTTRDLTHRATGALAALDGDHGPAATALRREVAVAYNRAALGVLPAGPVHGAGLGPQPVGACPVNFDDPDILATFANAQALFSTPPHWVQPCGNGTVHVEPLQYGHTHLDFEDPTINCLDLESGLYGRGGVGGCTPIQPADALQEPRVMGSHDGRAVIRIRRRVGGAASTFTLHSFVITGDEPVKLRYRTANGPWLQWDRLAGNTMWDVSAYVVGVTEVQMVHADGSFTCDSGGLTNNPPSCPGGDTAFFIDDLTITPPPVWAPRGR